MLDRRALSIFARVYVKENLSSYSFVKSSHTFALVDFMLLPFILGPNSLTSECLGRSEKLAENRRRYIKEVKESHKMCKDKSAHACIRQLSFSRLNGA